MIFDPIENDHRFTDDTGMQKLKTHHVKALNYFEF